MLKKVTTALCLVAFAAAAAASFKFEREARPVAEGRSPKFLSRRQHGLQMLTTKAAQNGRGFDLVYMSSSDLGDTWSEPLRVNSVPGEVTDHGENSPILLSSPDTATLYAVWNAREPGTSGVSTVRFARSASMMPRWSDAVTVNDDLLAVSHSFQGAAVAPDGTIYVAWLDGRDSVKEESSSHHGHTGGTSSLYLSKSSDGGKTWAKNIRVATSVCPCCRAAVAFSKGRVHVSWRGVDQGDIRDIYVASSSDKGDTWSKPVGVARDGWKINGCPHVGASMATLNDTLFVTWFSEAGGTPGVFLASSRDGGETFSPKRKVSELTTDPTHPHIAAGEDRLAVVFQARDMKAGDGWGKMVAYYREVAANGTLSPLVRVGESKAGASFPTVELGMSGRIFVAWTQTGNEAAAQAWLVRGRADRTPAAAGR